MPQTHRNRYQERKAKVLAASLLQAAIASDVPLSKLAFMAARMTHQQWISLSLANGLPVADLPARVYTIALLQRVAA